LRCRLCSQSERKKTQEEASTEPSCTDLTASQSGNAYRAAYNCALLAGAYGHGDTQWDKEYQEWLDSDSNESPDKFNNIDGKAYNDAVNAAEDAINLV